MMQLIIPLIWKQWGNVGDDFKEGKITLPIILAYGRPNRKEKEFEKSFQKPTTNKETLTLPKN